MDVDNAPREIWIPTYGTDSMFDDWFADPDMASEDDVKYIRADIHAAEIARLEDIIEALRKTGDRLLEAIDGENKTEPIVTSLGLTAMPVHANGKWAWSLAGEEEEE